MMKVINEKLHHEVIYFPRYKELGSPTANRTSDNGCFDLLPKELKLHIFSFLDFYSLVQCSQVSRLFRETAADPTLYTRVNLKPLFHLACNQTLKYLTSRSSLLRHLDMSRCGNYGKITPVVWRTFLYARGSKLTNLVLANCHVSTPSVLQALCSTCKNLVDLDLSNNHILDSVAYGPMFQLEKLQQLNLYRTQVDTRSLSFFLSHAKALQSLKIGACANINGDEISASIAQNCPNLVALDMWRCTTLTGRGVSSLSTLENLEDLDLGWCTNVLASTGCIQALVSSCTRLKVLLLTAHRQTSATDLDAIASSLSGTLTQFSCMGSRNIQPEAITNLASKCQNLELLDISYCDQLEGSSLHRQLCVLLPSCHVVTSKYMGTL